MRIEAGEFQNRGFLHMPFCPIYGVGMAAGSVALGSVKDSYAGLFVFGVIFCSVVEYIVGGILERLFRSKWWDYSHMRFNIQTAFLFRSPSSQNAFYSFHSIIFRGNMPFYFL